MDRFDRLALNTPPKLTDATSCSPPPYIRGGRSSNDSLQLDNFKFYGLALQRTYDFK